MPVFEYQALSKGGKTVKGVIDADTPVAARRKLREQELYPTALTEQSEGPARANGKPARTGGRVTGREVALLTRQLGVLLQAGMPLVEALTALLDQTSNQRLRKTVFDIRDRVNGGSTLADALAHHPRIFGELYTNMVRAGETSGALEGVLTRLADIQERTSRLKSKVMSTLAYPIVLAIVATGIIIFLMTTVVPRIMEVIQERGLELPLITKILIAITDFIGLYWYLLISGILLIGIGWRFWVSRPQGRRRWDSFKLRAPIFGNLYTQMVSARFARTLGTMLESGLNMMTALDVVKTVFQNVVIEEAMEEIKRGVRRGKDLARPLKESGLFPPMLIHMTELGQRSGQLESMLIKISDVYEEDVATTVDSVVGLLEPLIVVVMGMFVAFLVLSILLPILEMNKL